MSSVLVLTGVTTLADLAHSNVRPDFVARTLHELLPQGQEEP
jgi:ribonucleotide monophosphatase NagD (HAD superfamily)